MALTREDLQAIQQLLQPVLDEQAKTTTRLDRMEENIEKIDEDIDQIKEDIEQIKEDTRITREATNSLVAWADDVSVITQIKYPVKRATND